MQARFFVLLLAFVGKLFVLSWGQGVAPCKFSLSEKQTCYGFFAVSKFAFPLRNGRHLFGGIPPNAPQITKNRVHALHA